jgi:phage terminase small subunit
MQPTNAATDTTALTDKERLFVEHYLACWNATEAARRAGYSQRSARSIGSENLTKPNIRTRIEERLSEAAMGANEVLARLAEHARGSMGDFLRIDEEEVTLELSVTILSDQERDQVVLGGIAKLRELRAPEGEAGDDDPKVPAPKAMLVRTATVKRAVARLDLLQATDKLHLIKEYSLDDKGKVAIKLYDAKAALDKLGEHHRLFNRQAAGTADDPLHTVGQSLDEWKAAAAQRRAEAEGTLALLDEDGDA